MPLRDGMKQSQRIISRSFHEKGLRDNITRWSFIPHYPFPPKDRAWALGMQCGGTWKLALWVHTTHALLLDTDDPVYADQIPKGTNPDSVHLKPVLELASERVLSIFAPGHKFPKCRQNQNFLVLSNSACRGIYRVMLWYNNPYHFFTGFVEAEWSSGYPSQLDKISSGEHPMWLLCPERSYLVGHREGRVYLYIQYLATSSMQNARTATIAKRVSTLSSLVARPPRAPHLEDRMNMVIIHSTINPSSTTTVSFLQVVFHVPPAH